MSLLSLLVPLAKVELDAVSIQDTRVTITARSTQHAGVCPLCHSISSRIHSRYTRTVADLPCVGRPLSVLLQVRRFFCDVQHCARQTFAERFGAVLAPYARRLSRFTDALVAVAFATGGEGGARLAHVLAMPVSPRTLLRLLHAQPLPTGPAPRIVGLDDWAWKKGRNYGTLCVDLERRQPIDLLPDRTPEQVAGWLQDRPTITVVARDRGGTYIEAVTRGAPHATQVADRFHLVKNLGDAVTYFFHHHSSALKQAAHTLNVPDGPLDTVTRLMPARDRATGQARATVAGRARYARMLDRYHRVQALHAKQVEIQTIARQLGVSRKTVYRYLRRARPPEPTRIHLSRPQLIEPFIPYLVQRWNEGCRNATQLWREVRDEHGFTHGARTVSRFVTTLRRDSGVPYKFRTAAAAPFYTADHEPQRPLTALQAMRLLLTQPDQRTTWQQAYLHRLCELEPRIARTDDLVQVFVMMVRQRAGAQLDRWLTEVAASGIRELQSFATGLRRDYAAVKHGLTRPESNGQTEAQIQRLKLLKRQMYGKAGFELLRKRVLYRERPYPVRARGRQPARAAA